MNHPQPTKSPTSPSRSADSDLRARFDAAGWMVLRGVLPDCDLDPVREAFAAAVERFGREWHAEGKISSQRLDLPWHERLEAYRREHPPSHSHSWRACIATEGVWRMWQHPALVEVMRSLIGPELWASGTWNGRPRTSGHEKETIGWHQDLH